MLADPITFLVLLDFGFLDFWFLDEIDDKAIFDLSLLMVVTILLDLFDDALRRDAVVMLVFFLFIVLHYGDTCS